MGQAGLYTPAPGSRAEAPPHPSDRRLPGIARDAITAASEAKTLERTQVQVWLRSYWDTDAATFDLAPSHIAPTAAEQAAWRAVFARHLPPPPARILDVGAGTGFLSIPLARLGYRVTALDVSSGMLACLRSRARGERLEVGIVEGVAEEPPAGPYDAVVERLLLWTLPEPEAALTSWRRVAAGARLLCFEGAWGRADRMEAIRSRVREALRRLRRLPREHHDEYSASLSARLPFGRGMNASAVAAVMGSAGWSNVRLERLRDVEWAKSVSLSFLDRLLGVTPEFLVIADDAEPRHGAAADMSASSEP